MRTPASMKTLNPVRTVAKSAFGRDLRTQLAIVEAAYAETGRRRLRLARWPVALHRSIGDRRLRRERTFWRAIARTTDTP